jgi:hypothetical protein
MPTRNRDLAVTERLSRMLDRLLDGLADRVGDRVADRLEATWDVATDRDLIRDLETADAQPDEEARSFDEIRAARVGRA